MTKFDARTPAKRHNVPKSLSDQQVSFKDVGTSASLANEHSHKTQFVYHPKDAGAPIPADSSGTSVDVIPGTEASSGASTPPMEAEANGSPMKTLMQRLSIWEHIPKGVLSMPEKNSDAQQGLLDDDDSMPKGTDSDPNPDVRNSSSDAERQSALDIRIVGEIVREFTKGGMYFSYTFGLST